jgi:uroporphyrinogen-III synthase
VGRAAGNALQAKRVVITRAKEQAGELAAALEAAGALTILFPVIRLLPPEDYAPLDGALRRLREFDWILLTSRNAVKALAARTSAIGLDLGEIVAEAQVGVVGRVTADAARGAGLRVTHVASRALGKALAEDLRRELRGKRVFLPRSDQADPDLVRAIEAEGAQVSEVIAYRTRTAEAPSAETIRQVNEADAILFFSPSAVRAFRELVGESNVRELSRRAIGAAVGPATMEAMKTISFREVAMAEDASVEGVMNALTGVFLGCNGKNSMGAKSA